MGGVEKVTKSVAQTDWFWRSLLITLQFWTPEATISVYLNYTSVDLIYDLCFIREGMHAQQIFACNYEGGDLEHKDFITQSARLLLHDVHHRNKPMSSQLRRRVPAECSLPQHVRRLLFPIP